MWTVLLFAALLAQNPIPEGEQALAAGEKALDEGRYDAAAQLFTQAVAAAPRDVSAHFNLALAYNLLGRDAEAIPEYKKVIELNPQIYEAYVNLGQTLIRSREAAAAIEPLQKAVALKPGEFKAHFYLGEALFEMQRFDDAVPAYTEAIKLDASSAPATLGLGRSLVKANRAAEAEPHYRRSVVIDGEYRTFLLELAEQYEAAGDATRAIALYREFPENAGAQERIAMLALKAGDNDAAVAALEAAVAKSPTAANRIALADAYVRQKQLAKAEPLLKEAVAAEPNDFGLRLFYARLLRDQRKAAEAAREFLAATKLKPDAAEAWRELAGELILAEQYTAAIDALDRVRQLGAENVGVYFFRATSHDRLGQRKEALEYYTKFLEASAGGNPDQEFQARQRIRVLELELGRR